MSKKNIHKLLTQKIHKNKHTHVYIYINNCLFMGLLVKIVSLLSEGDADGPIWVQGRETLLWGEV